MTARLRAYARPAADLAAHCGQRVPGDDWVCTAAAGHEPLDHAAYDGASDAPLYTWPSVEVVPVKLTAVPAPAAQPRLFTYSWCGGHGTQPTHRANCHRKEAARIWSSLPAADARIALARWKTAVEATATSGLDATPDEWDRLRRTERAAAAALGPRLLSLLTEIDVQAGAL